MKFLFSLLAGVSFGICPNDDWTVEAGNVKCSPRDLLVTCNKSGLSIKVTNKHVYTNMPASMASNAKVEIGTCDNKFTVSTGEDGKLDGYTATINFDECGVLLQQPSSETISYSWKVKGTLASAKIGVITVTEPLEFQVSCNFDATISLKSSETSVASMDTELTDISSDTSDSVSNIIKTLIKYISSFPRHSHSASSRLIHTMLHYQTSTLEDEFTPRSRVLFQQT
jgi:hypothetical protein